MFSSQMFVENICVSQVELGHTTFSLLFRSSSMDCGFAQK